MRSRTTTVAAMFAALLLTACTAAPSLVTQPVTVRATIDRSASIGVTMSSGNVRLVGGAAALVEGEATYPSADGEFRVESGSQESTAGKVATVDVSQGSVAALTPGPRMLDLRLNGGLPVDLKVTQQSGDADLDLRLADPKDLDVSATSGNVDVRLSGPHPSLSHAALSLVSGNTSIAADGEYPALEAFSVKSGSGNVRLDLAGTWRKSFTARVIARSGNVTLVLPRDVNVRVVGTPGSGSTSAEGFMQRGEGWERKADAPSDFTLIVEVGLTSGNLTLQAASKK